MELFILEIACIVITLIAYAPRGSFDFRRTTVRNPKSWAPVVTGQTPTIIAQNWN